MSWTTPLASVGVALVAGVAAFALPGALGHGGPAPSQRAVSSGYAAATLSRTPAAAGAFYVGTFNQLVETQTNPGGPDAYYAPASLRSLWAADVIRRDRLDIVGLQELHPMTLASMEHNFPGYSFWPAKPSDIQGMPESALMWRRSRFSVVSESTVPMPFLSKAPLERPVVELKDKTTGKSFWVFTTHNVRKTHPTTFAQDRTIEINEVKTLTATGLPVLFIGDLNDHQSIFCSITGQTTMHAAQGGSTGTPCTPPRRMRIDWLFGSPQVRFSDFLVDRDALVTMTTDHAVVSAEVSLP